MNKITPQDIKKGVESVSANPESTWYKVIETLDNGDELCLAIGMGEGFDEDTVCAKLGILAGNSAMSDYVWDFQMPWNLKGDGNDVWDTEVSNPGESDAEWFNKTAQEMIKGLESGEIGTSLLGSACGKKKGKKKAIKSARRPIQSMYVTEDISGNDLYTRLWSGGKDQFDSMIEDGADADDILDVCEQLLFTEEGNPPTITELNDLIWFEPDTIREMLGLGGEIESGCNKKSKKSKKPVKSARRSIQSMARGYLKPEYDSRASFYNKAETDDDKLYSYGTLVAEIVDGKPVLYDDWDYSQTTLRHVKEFLRQHGFTAESKSQMARDYLTNSRKALKSSYFNPYNGEGEFLARIEVVQEGEHDTVSFSSNVMPLTDFLQECKDYAESTNGYYTVTENGENQYKFTFETSDDSFADEPGTDPYYTENCGVVIVELIYPFDRQMAEYMENPF